MLGYWLSITGVAMLIGGCAPHLHSLKPGPSSSMLAGEFHHGPPNRLVLQTAERIGSVLGELSAAAEKTPAERWATSGEAAKSTSCSDDKASTMGVRSPVWSGAALRSFASLR